MDKYETLQQIAELLDLQENAIQQHPVKTATVYLKGRSAFIEGQGTATETEWAHFLSLSLDELSLMHRYMLSSSFISAWYHLSGDKNQRDKTAHSCSTLVASLGPDPEQVMLKYIERERLWRDIMKYEGIAPQTFRFIVPTIIAAVIVLISIIMFYW